MNIKNYLRAGVISLLSFFACAPLARASHIVGADLYYTHVSGNTYKITVVLYGDCGPASAGAFSALPSATPSVCVYDGTSMMATVMLTPDVSGSNIEITPLCPGDTSQCTNPSSIVPGVKKFKYDGNYTLPHTSSLWRFVYQGYNAASGSAGRAAAITNIASAGATMIQLIDTLNNTTYNNSSPALTVSQQTFFCNAQHDNYTPGIVDPEGDSVVVSLVSAINGSGSASCSSSGSTVTYAGSAWPGTPVSAVKPLHVLADSFSIDSSTGKLVFHPNTLQRAVLVYNIREYRSGTLVGSSQREMTVHVLDCTSTFPCMLTATTSNRVPANNSFEVYPNPANDILHINTLINNGSLSITNEMGQTLMQSTVISRDTKLDISFLPPGVYNITVISSYDFKVHKFIKLYAF